LFSKSSTVTGLESDGRGEVVYRHTSLYSDVILDRIPETYENVRIRLGCSWLLAKMPVTFYSKREGEMASAGNLNEDSICKRNKKVSIIV
jgi:hypothetical protein